MILEVDLRGLLDWLVLVLCFYSFPLCAQPGTDSLESLLQHAGGREKAELLLDLAGNTRLGDVEKAIAQAGEALQLARDGDYDQTVGKALRRLGFLHSSLGQNGEALEYYLEALKIARGEGNIKAESKVLYQLGRFYSDQENYEKALEYYFAALDIQRALDDTKGVASTLFYIGTLHASRDVRKDALSFFRQSYQLASDIGDYRRMAMSASEMGILYQEANQLDTSILFYREALSAAEELGSVHAQAAILFRMSTAYQDNDRMEEAVALNRKQVELGKSHRNKSIEAQGYQHLAELYYVDNQLDRAIKYLQQADSIYRQLGYARNVVIIANQMGSYLLEQDAGAAVEIISRALRQARAAKMIEQQEIALNNLIQAYSQQENYDQALQAQSHLIEFKDSIFNIEKEKQIAAIQTQYQTRQKEREIASLENAQKSSRLIRNAMAVVIALMLIIGLLLISRQRLKIAKKETEIENNRLEEEKLQDDLAFKNKQLTTHSLHLIQKNETLKDLKEEIGELRKALTDESLSGKLRSVDHLVDHSFNLDHDWKEFRLYFERVHPGFTEKLQSKFPDLTPNDYRLATLIKLQMTTKEMASILGISPNSVKTARYRLRKRLDLDSEDNLTEFLIEV